MVSSTTGDKVLMHLYGTSQSIVLNVPSLVIADTIDCDFNSGQYFEDYGVYVWGNGGIRRLNPETFEVEATSTFSPCSRLLLTSNGEICFTVYNDQWYYKLDSGNLSVIESANLPFALDHATLIEADNKIYCYLVCDYSYSFQPYVCDLETMSIIGQVTVDEVRDLAIYDMLGLSQTNQIWCTFILITDPWDSGVLNIIE